MASVLLSCDMSMPNHEARELIEPVLVLLRVSGANLMSVV